ncbi:MAG: hypothetical protein AAF437_16685 [Pseudomonadota bacterium]
MAQISGKLKRFLPRDERRWLEKILLVSVAKLETFLRRTSITCLHGYD